MVPRSSRKALAPAVRSLPGKGPASFHRRVAGTNWEARPQRGFLGLSLLAHVALFGVGAAAVVRGAIGERAAPRPVVSVALRTPAAATSAPSAAPRPEPDPPPLEVEQASLEEPLPPAPTTESSVPEPPAELAPLERFPRLPRSWSAARLEPARPPADPEPPALREPEVEPDPAPPEEQSASAPVPPTLVEAPAPVYPGRARRQGQEGSVDCLLSVEADGSVSTVRVLRSSGFEALDDAARRALLRWRFRPGLRLGRPEAFEVEHRVTFVLE